MNQNDARDRSIDEALRLAASGQPPAGHLDRLQRRIEAAPNAHRVRGGLWLWVPAGCAVAAVFLVAVLPVLLRPSKPMRIAVAPTSNTADLAKASVTPTGLSLKAEPKIFATRRETADSSTSLRSARNDKALLRSTLRKPKRAAMRDTANLFDYPLTHQERLLVEFARTATPDELKELNPEYQAKVQAQQEAEFAAYLKSGEDSGNISMSSTGAEADSEVKIPPE